MRAILATLIVCCCVSAAQAGQHRATHDPRARAWSVSASDPRPSAWCGWFLRHKLGVADRAFNLARNWFHWGHAVSGPRIGAVVVAYHHVGLIVGHDARGWLVEQGNPYRNGPDKLRWAVAFRQ